MCAFDLPGHGRDPRTRRAHEPGLSCLSRERRGSTNFLLRRSRGGPNRCHKNRCARPARRARRDESFCPSLLLFFLLEAAKIHIHTQSPGVLAPPTFPTCYLPPFRCPLASTLPKPWCLLIIWPSALPPTQGIFGRFFSLSIFLLLEIHRHHLHVGTCGYLNVAM